jgi:hypothetical protein
MTVATLPLPRMPGARTPDVVARLGAPITIERLPQAVNLILYRGDDFALVVEVTDAEGDPADLTGAVVRAQIRTAPDAGQVEGEFSPAVEDNLVVLHLLGSVSAGLPPSSVYDAEVEIEGAVTTLVAGTIALTPDVTR